MYTLLVSGVQMHPMHSSEAMLNKLLKFVLFQRFVLINLSVLTVPMYFSVLTVPVLTVPVRRWRLVMRRPVMLADLIIQNTTLS